mgnify:CR=1 FL=1
MFFFSYKLFFKYLFFPINFIFLKVNYFFEKINILFLHKTFIYYSFLHFKLSSLFYLNQLIDIFAYEINFNLNYKNYKLVLNKHDNEQFFLIIYNLHILTTNTRIYLFFINSLLSKKNNKNIVNFNLMSITELYFSAN